jgi:hypothetical protein
MGQKHVLSKLHRLRFNVSKVFRPVTIPPIREAPLSPATYDG